MFVTTTLSKFSNRMYGQAKRSRKCNSQIWSRYKNSYSYNDDVDYKIKLPKSIEKLRKSMSANLLRLLKKNLSLSMLILDQGSNYLLRI